MSIILDYDNLKWILPLCTYWVAREKRCNHSSYHASYRLSVQVTFFLKLPSHKRYLSQWGQNIFKVGFVFFALNVWLSNGTFILPTLGCHKDKPSRSIPSIRYFHESWIPNPQKISPISFFLWDKMFDGNSIKNANIADCFTRKSYWKLL